MGTRTRWLLRLATVTAGLAAAGVALSGALTARRAARAAALEAEVLARNIGFLEAKLAGDSKNWLLAGHLADLYMLRFRAEADLADVARAEALARNTLAVHADRSAGLARVSAILLTQHRFREAYDAARAAISGTAPSQAALAAFVDAARALGDDAAADSALERLDRRSFAATVRWADRFSGDGRLDAAIAHVERACRRLDEAAAARELRAWCITKRAALEHSRKGPSAARALLRHALKVRPEHRGATEMLADLAYAQQRWPEARRLYERIVTAAHPDLHLRLAEVNRALGNDVDATRHERHFITLAWAPGAEALNALPLAVYLADGQRCAEALRLAAGELGRRRSAAALEGVAWIRFRCDDAGGAASALRQAAAMTEPSASAAYLQGLLRRAAGDDAAADALITQATSDPTQLEPHVLVHIRRSASDAS